MESNRTAPDDQLIEELALALQAERRRAPADLLVILGLVLVVGALGFLLAAIVVGAGIPQVVLLNLATELIGALVTVVLIGALWQRLQVTALGQVDALSQAIEASRSRSLTSAERVVCERLIEIHREAASAPPVVRQLRAVVFAVRHRAELAAIEGILRSAPRP